MLPRIITKVVGWAVALFYDIERTGASLPDGPVLLAANHPNALVDPLVLFHTAGRPTRPLAKAPLFEQALVGTVLKGLGGLPVYRKQDDPALMHLNDRTFDAAVDALVEGGAVQIYPEGQSHSEPSMTSLRTGAARIALLAEARAGWKLGLRVQPVGLIYQRKHLFRGRVIAAYGDPIRPVDFRVAYERDQRTGVRALTEAIREALEGVTLNFESERDGELVDVAERLYARGKGMTGSRERAPLAERLPRLRRFADGIRWLQSHDPDRLERLRATVSRYLRLLTLFGVTAGDAPRRYRLGAVVAYALAQLARLVLLLPAALVGAAFWLTPYLLTRTMAPRFRPTLDQVATYKVAVAMVAFPTWLALVAGVGGLLAGWRVAVVVAFVAPVAGLSTIAWRERQSVVREDVRIFLRARRRSQSIDRLAEVRRGLVAEFEAIWRLRERSGGSTSPEEPTVDGIGNL